MWCASNVILRDSICACSRRYFSMVATLNRALEGSSHGGASRPPAHVSITTLIETASDTQKGTAQPCNASPKRQRTAAQIRLVTDRSGVTARTGWPLNQSNLSGSRVAVTRTCATPLHSPIITPKHNFRHKDYDAKGEG
ncbi:hypothetical protein PMIN02_012203 [Paraphaeosphaeria minitans]